MGNNGNLGLYSCFLLLSSTLGFPAGACNAGDVGSILGLGRTPGGETGYPLQYCCLGNSHGQRSLCGYSPWGHKESNMTEHACTYIFNIKFFPSGLW